MIVIRAAAAGQRVDKRVCAVGGQQVLIIAQPFSIVTVICRFMSCAVADPLFIQFVRSHKRLLC